MIVVIMLAEAAPRPRIVMSELPFDSLSEAASPFYHRSDEHLRKSCCYRSVFSLSLTAYRRRRPAARTTGFNDGRPVQPVVDSSYETPPISYFAQVPHPLGSSEKLSDRVRRSDGQSLNEFGGLTNVGLLDRATRHDWMCDLTTKRHQILEALLHLLIGRVVPKPSAKE